MYSEWTPRRNAEKSREANAWLPQQLIAVWLFLTGGDDRKSKFSSRLCLREKVNENAVATRCEHETFLVGSCTARNSKNCAKFDKLILTRSFFIKFSMNSHPQHLCKQSCQTVAINSAICMFRESRIYSFIQYFLSTTRCRFCCGCDNAKTRLPIQHHSL